MGDRIVDTAEWQTLAEHAATMQHVHLRELFAADPQRGTDLAVTAGDLYIDYSKHRISAQTPRMLVALARRAGVESLRDAMFAGEHINVTEDRAVLHVALRAPRDDRRMIPLVVILQVHAYALVGTSVHENHTFLAVVLAPLLIGIWPRATRLLAAVSAFLFASLYFAAGLGRRITTQAGLEAFRMALGFDLSVLVAVAHVALVAALFVWVARTSSGRLRSVAP